MPDYFSKWFVYFLTYCTIMYVTLSRLIHVLGRFRSPCTDDVPQPKSSSQVSQVIQKYSSRNPSENTFQDSRLAKNLRRKVKKRQAALKSTLLTKTDSQSVDSIDDTKSSSSAASLGGSSDKSDELVVRKQESQVLGNLEAREFNKRLLIFLQ